MVSENLESQFSARPGPAVARDAGALPRPSAPAAPPVFPSHLAASPQPQQSRSRCGTQNSREAFGPAVFLYVSTLRRSAVSVLPSAPAERTTRSHHAE